MHGLSFVSFFILMFIIKYVTLLLMSKLQGAAHVFCDLDQRTAELFNIYLFAEFRNNANIIRAHFPAAGTFFAHVVLLA